MDTIELNGKKYREVIETSNRVIVRCRNAGVHVGTLKHRDSDVLVLTSANRIWRWRGAHDLSYVAMHGVNRTEHKTEHHLALDRLDPQPGDKFRVLRKADDREAGWSDDWVVKMDAAVGRVGVVAGDTTDSGVFLRIDGMSTHCYPAHVLELVERAKPKPKQKLPTDLSYVETIIYLNEHRGAVASRQGHYGNDSYTMQVPHGEGIIITAMGNPFPPSGSDLTARWDITSDPTVEYIADKIARGDTSLEYDPATVAFKATNHAVLDHFNKDLTDLLEAVEAEREALKAAEGCGNVTAAHYGKLHGDWLTARQAVYDVVDRIKKRQKKG